MGYLEGFGVTARQHRLFGGKRLTANYSGGRAARRHADEGELPPPDAEDDVKAPKPARLHGRHVLGRYEDGMEKCIGCELCAGVCPAKCIYVRGADNDPEDPTSPGERFGFVYEINYLRCIHCDLCVEACPTEAITESKLFEFSFTNRGDAIYTKVELLVDDEGRPRHLPWEDWRQGEDADTSGWVRATAPSGDADFIGQVGWSPELGYGLRAPEATQDVADRQGGEGELMDLVVFVIASLMVVGGAIGVVIRRHPVHCALSLVLTLFGVAVHFVALDAHFLAAVQVIVYAGAIVVLFLFVIMLLGVDRAEDLRVDPLPIQRPLAAVMGVGIVGLLIAAVVAARDANPLSVGAGLDIAGEPSAAGTPAGHDANIQQLADNLFGANVFAFELTSVLLIVAVAGTVVLTRRQRRRAPAADRERVTT